MLLNNNGNDYDDEDDNDEEEDNDNGDDDDDDDEHIEWTHPTSVAKVKSKGKSKGNQPSHQNFRLRRAKRSKQQSNSYF